MSIKAPGKLNSDKISDVKVTSIDFYSTILDFAHIDLKHESHVDGISVFPYITKNSLPERKSLFWHYPHYHGSTWTPGAALRHEDWKLIVFYEYEKVELYNLKDDPSEKKDLSEAMPEKVNELQDILEKWQNSVDAQMPAKNPDFKSDLKFITQ